MISFRRFRSTLYALIGFLVLFGGSATALDPTVAITQYVHEFWTVNEGLPDNGIRGIFQTPDGYLWIRTATALIRFDGIRFVVFDNTTTPAFRGVVITAAYGDRLGRIWIGTSRGELLLFQSGVWKLIPLKGINHSIEAILEDHTGALWIASEGSGLLRIMNGDRTIFTVNNGLASNLVKCLYEDSVGSLWIGTSDGMIGRYQNGNWKSYGFNDPQSRKVVIAIAQDNQGNVLAGTKYGGLKRFSDGKWIPFGSSGDDSVAAIILDRNRNLWIGNEKNGLSRLSSSTWDHYSAENGLGSDLVNSLFEDREGSLWVGTDDAGLHRFRNPKGQMFTHAEGLPDTLTRVVAEDHDGNVLVGTGTGLFAWNNGKWSSPAAALTGVVSSLFPASDGSLWIGSPKGLFRIIDGKLSRIVFNNQADSIVLAIYEDREGSVWVGTRPDGLYCLKDGKWIHFTSDNGLTNNSVRYILQDRQGSIWVATNGGGINCLSNGKWRSYTTREGLSENRVASLYEDSSGRLWIGTDGGGLDCLVNNRLKNITTAQGLFNDSIWGILEDDLGYLWMDSEGGIFRVNKKELDDFVDEKRNDVVSVLVAAGLKPTGGAQTSAWKAKNGNLWFALTKGLLVLDPHKVEDKNPVVPTVIVENATIEGITIHPIKGESLSARSIRDVEFQYTCLSLLQPQKNRFKYMLKGFDKDWIDSGTRRSAFYTNLPPGNYEFRVKACNNDGIWNEQGESIPFEILPFFYETPWFYAACGLFAFGTIAGGYRFSVHRSKVREAKLSALVASRTGELQRENEQRVFVEKELKQMTMDLENRIVERTYDLERQIVERKNAEQEIRQLAEQRSRLLSVSQMLLSTLSLETILQRILQELRRVVPYDVCGYFLIDREEGLLRPSVLVKPELLTNQSEFWQIPIDKGIVGSVAEQGKGELVNNADRDPRSYYPEGTSKFECEHLIAVPVRPSGITPGVFIMNRLSDPPFSNDDYELVQLFINNFTFALQNAGLFEELTRARDHLEARVEDRTHQLEESLEQLRTEVIRREKTEQSLLRSIVTNRALLEAVPDMILRVSQDGTILNYKTSREQFMEKDYGFEIEEQQLIQRNIHEFLPPTLVEGVLNQIHQTLQTKEIQIAEYRNEIPQKGSARFYEVRMVSVGENEVIAIIRDFSDRKRQERAKDEFISIVSHELRTPLTSLIGSLKLLTGGVVGEVPEHFKRLLDVSVKSGERLTELVNDILDLSKLELGQMMLRIQPQWILPLVKQSMETNRQLASQFGVTIILEDGETDATVEVDANRFLQVLSNLLSNAIKFSPHNEEVRVSLRKQQDAVQVLVSDHGPGIPEEFKPRVFEKFAQADATDNRKQNGTGLGLCIAKSLMERMNGSIGFDSTPGGTTFYLVLPRVVLPASLPESVQSGIL